MEVIPEIIKNFIEGKKGINLYYPDSVITFKGYRQINSKID
jgi:hypothetical protein